MATLDHAIVFVRALETAAPAFRRLGFTLSPRSGHPALGTANHTIMLARTYLELLTVETPSPANARWTRILATREGFGAVAFGTRDVAATRAGLAERGVATPEPVRFSRPVSRAAGSAEARFTVAFLPDEATPAIPGFFCQHHTPELVWLPELTEHPNTATHLAGLTVVCPEPEAVAPAYERLLGRAAVHPHPGGLALDLRGTRLWVVSPRFAAARLGRAAPTLAGTASVPIGLTVTVRDLDAARRLLAANGVPFAPFGARSVTVPGAWAAGVELELVAG